MRAGLWTRACASTWRTASDAAPIPALPVGASMYGRVVTRPGLSGEAERNNESRLHPSARTLCFIGSRRQRPGNGVPVPPVGVGGAPHKTVGDFKKEG